MAKNKTTVFLKRFLPAGLSVVLSALLLVSPVASQVMPEHFDDKPVESSKDSQLQLGTLSYQFFLDDTVSGKGFFSINNNGVSDPGTDESDLYLIALGTRDETNSLRVVSGGGNFRLKSVVLTKGVFGTQNIRIEGLLNGVVQGSIEAVLQDNAPLTNPAQLIEVSGAQWAPLDAFRIITSDGTADFDIELDDLLLNSYCTAGTFLQADTGNCAPAPAGFHVPVDESDMAIPCAPGTFQDEMGQAECKLAPLGKFVATEGAAEAVACPIGRYQDETGQAECKLAPLGKFVAIEGASMAEICVAGSYQDETGQAECKLAPLGKFVATEGAAEAVACPIGRYQDETGQAECKLAPLGKFVATEGASMAEICVAGSYQDEKGQAECKLAPPGTFVDSDGAIAAQACIGDSFQDRAGATQCLPCVEGTIATLDKTACFTLAPPNTPTIERIDASDGEIRVFFRSVTQAAETVTYTVKCISSSGNRTSVDTSTSPAILIDLDSDETYQCTIQAENDAGLSNESTVFTAQPENVGGLNLILIKAAIDNARNSK